MMLIWFSSSGMGPWEEGDFSRFVVWTPAGATGMENAARRGAFDLVIDVGALAGTITATYLWLAPLFLPEVLFFDVHAIPS